jgi:thioredoxin 1
MDTISTASVIHLGESNFNETIREAKVPVLVEFRAPWSGPCRMLAPVLDEIAAELDEKVRVGKVDVDNNLALSNRLGIRDIPTVLIFKYGELKDQVVGLVSKVDLVPRLNRVQISRQGRLKKRQLTIGSAAASSNRIGYLRKDLGRCLLLQGSKSDSFSGWRMVNAIPSRSPIG